MVKCRMCGKDCTGHLTDTPCPCCGIKQQMGLCQECEDLENHLNEPTETDIIGY